MGPLDVKGCHTPKCGENEVAVAGHARRDRFCRPAYTPHQLFIQRRKCICKPRYVRNSWDECVPRNLCRRCKCRLQKDWHLCSSACPVTYNMTVPFCSKMCVPGCDCPPGWVVSGESGVIGGVIHEGNGHASVATTSAVGGAMHGAGNAFTNGNTGSRSGGSTIEGAQPSSGTSAHSPVAAGSAMSGAITATERTTTEGAAAGINTAGGSASALGGRPGSLSFHPGAVPVGPAIGWSPVAAASGATAGITTVGGSSHSVAAGRGTGILHPGASSGGLAAGLTPGTMAAGANAGMNTVGETTATAGPVGMHGTTGVVPSPVVSGIGPGITGVTIVPGGALTSGGRTATSTNGAGTTTLLSTGANSGGSNVGLSGLITLASGNTAAVGAGSGVSYQPVYLVYGVPPPTMLTNGTLLSRGGASGPVVYSRFPEFSHVYPEGVDIGEAPPSSASHADVEENANDASGALDRV
ncbi:hypothetical protein HPB49_013580 [Dermacentor silvarum]|uniref:Uncharacterized protein n=1 Tax=Dermacentor silvarum TaxID=543639 RepID=A0ACB8C3X2_DERSI|nr:hypothetical protein HPB49_013580 [Dermacentor silvarum]